MPKGSTALRWPQDAVGKKVLGWSILHWLGSKACIELENDLMIVIGFAEGNLEVLFGYRSALPPEVSDPTKRSPMLFGDQIQGREFRHEYLDRDGRFVFDFGRFALVLDPRDRGLYIRDLFAVGNDITAG